MLQLIENSMTDSTYVEDFLLTHRTFTSSPLAVAQQLLTWFETESTTPAAPPSASASTSTATSNDSFTSNDMSNNTSIPSSSPPYIPAAAATSTQLIPIPPPPPPPQPPIHRQQQQQHHHHNHLHHHHHHHHQHTPASSSAIRDRVAIVVLLWVNNHFTDFESDPQMMDFLETFGAGLERKLMHDRHRLLYFACAAKARTRNITLARSSRTESLQFDIVGGYERTSSGIFVSNVVRGSKPELKGLKRGDQILEVNGYSFEHVTNARALELLTSTTHLSITIKSNLLAFKDLMAVGGDESGQSPRSRNVRRKQLSDIGKMQGGGGGAALVARQSSCDLLSSDQTDFITNAASGGFNGAAAAAASPLPSPSPMGGGSKYVGIGSASAKKPTSDPKTGGGSFLTMGPKRRLHKALIKMNLLPKNAVTLLMEGLIAGTGNGGSGPNAAHNGDEDNGSTGGGTNSTSSGSVSSLHQSQSNPDLIAAVNAATASIANTNATVGVVGSGSTTSYYDEFMRHADYPEHVLKVYRADQSCKYLLVHKETTAHEVVMLALQEFGCHESSSMFSLCEVSVGDGGMIKQRRLPEQLQNLAERIGLASRYYLKTNGLTETLVPDEMAPELIRDVAVHFLQLNANELAVQLSLQDFAIFRQIESTEYVDDLFVPSKAKAEEKREKAAAAAAAAASSPNADTTSTRSDTSTSTTSSAAAATASNTCNNNNNNSANPHRYGMPMLRQFAELVNREMFWVVTEVCSEPNPVRRMKIVKQFVKIARQCKECRNFNSMFALISGLGHASVSRLRQTWEKLPGKYQRLFDDLQELMDPSRNMSKYRQLVSAEMSQQNPIIPFYPVVKKDLTFIHLGNDTLVDGLINFEKLRMIAKEVRSLTKMCSKDLMMHGVEMKGGVAGGSLGGGGQTVMTLGGGGVGSGSVASVGGGSSGGGSLAGGLGGLGFMLGGGQATVKRRKKSTAAPNPKKMFEEAQMVRRVKSYLNNMRVITDEERLHQLSLECEPAPAASGSSGGFGSSGGGGYGGSGGFGGSSGSGGFGGQNASGGGGSIGGGNGVGSGSIGSGSVGSSAPNTSLTSRKRHPSPSLSTTSSTSSSVCEAARRGGLAAATAAAAAASASTTATLGPKFGTASPQSVKKILSLSETTKTRPHQPMRHPTAATTGAMLTATSSAPPQQQQQHFGGHNGALSPLPSPAAHRRVGSSSSAGKRDMSEMDFVYV